jgi:hypothetical protein
MNQQMLEVLAQQRRADFRDQASRVQQPHGFWKGMPRQSLREWTGWALVDLGLKIVAEHSRGPAPRPAGS